MRRAILIKSVQEHIGGDRTVEYAVYMWRRHQLWLPFVVATAIGVLLVGQLFSFESANLVLVALLVSAVAGAASTRYFVLARSGDEIYLLSASPIRRVAQALITSEVTQGDIVAAGNTMLATDWSVLGETYTVPKSCEQDMQAIIA